MTARQRVDRDEPRDLVQQLGEAGQRPNSPMFVQEGWRRPVRYDDAGEVEQADG